MISKQQFPEILWICLLVLIVVGVFITWATTPLADDVRVFFASARQADYLGDFPFNVFRSFELKPVGNRLFVYTIYRAAILFVDFSDKVDFERVAKLVYGAVLFLVVGLGVFRSCSLIRQLGFHPILLLCAVLISFLFLSFNSALQAEDFSILVFMGALSLGLSKLRIMNLASGTLLAGLFFTKGITILLAPQLLLLLLILGQPYRQRLYICTLGLVGSLAIFVATLALVYPQELQHLYEAGSYQGPFLNRIQNFSALTSGYLSSIPHVPILLPGLVYAWMAVPMLIRYRNWPHLAALSSLWVLSALILLLQSIFFPYHYVVFMVPALYSIYLLVWLSSHAHVQQKMAWQLAIPAALGLVVVQIIAGLYSEGLAARLLLTLVAVTGFGVAALTDTRL